MFSTVLLLALIWGALVAWFLRSTTLGRMLNQYLNWFATSVGCGVNILLLLPLVQEGAVQWWYIPTIFFVSSVPVAVAGLWDLRNYFGEMMLAAREGYSQRATTREPTA